MGVFLLFVAVDPVMIQEVYTNTGISMKDIPLTQDYSNMDNLALFVIKECQITLSDFSHEINGTAQFYLLLTVTGYLFSHHSVE